MKMKQLSEILAPVLKQAKQDNDSYCMVYFSRSQDAYASEFDLDSGDALIVIEELVRHAGIDPQALKQMLDDMDAPSQPFAISPQAALLLACGGN